MFWKRGEVIQTKSAFIFAETDGEPHNTITPIARRSGDMFELDLTLRNNITTDEHPLGVYHPHAEYHHIKKREYWSDRSNGTCRTSGKIKRRTGTSGRIYSGGKRHFLPMRRLRNMQRGLQNSFRNMTTLIKTTFRMFSEKKSVMYSFMYLRMPAYINALLKAEKHL